MMMTIKKIPDESYRNIVKSIPISTVDIVVIRNGREFLLTKRANKPFKGKWFIPGCRIQHSEMMMDCVERQLVALGIGLIESIDFLCVTEMICPPGQLGVRQHSICHVFAVRVEEYIEPEPDDDSTEVKWFHSIDPKWPKPVVEMLLKAGFQVRKKN